MIGDLVGAAGAGDVDLDHDQVGRVVEVERLDVLVGESDVVIGVEVCGERGQPERWEQRVLDRPEAAGWWLR